MFRTLARRRSRALAVPVLGALLAAASLGLASCGTNTATTAPAFDQATIDEIDDMVAKIMERNKVPGAIVGIWWEGHGEYVMAYGEADLATGRAMSPADLFKAASTTKTITGNLVLQLVSEGKLGLDDKLSGFEFARGVTNADGITIRMLLNQTSGLPDPSNENEEMIAVESSEPLHAFTQEEVMAYGQAMPVLSQPGESYHYSNWNYYLLGMIVEQVTGMSLDQAIQARFAEPLGLTDTRLDADCSFLLSRQHSNGYAWDEAQPGEDKYVDATAASTSWTWAAGSVTTDIDDLRVWIEAVADGSLISPSTYEEQIAVVPTGDGKPGDYRQGIIEAGGFYWHNGAVPGYSSYAASNPEEGLTVCVFMNLMPGPELEGSQPGSQYMLATTTAGKLVNLLEGL
ncbi:MAG: class A beta-lactamase-related serine hydrolase [Actinobacteria bacterium]|nr:MAG: class A beta-lactamase-related serine hydrolase [Actinomycetota bacterium]